MTKKTTFFLFLLFPFLIYSQEKQFQVFFDFDISETNQASCQKLNDWIEQNPTAEVLKIYGYCDAVGSFEYNDTLSLKRANYMMGILKSNSISIKENIEIKGFGERFEKSKIDAENRKAVIFYTIPEKVIVVSPKEIISEEPTKVITEEKKPETLTVAIKTTKVGDKLRLKNLNFYNRSGRMVKSSIPIVEELLKIMQENLNLKIEIQGHICCQIWTDLEDIAMLRLKAVYDFLIENDINKSRLKYKSFGSSLPLYPIPEKSEWEKDQNRRVEILILEN